MPGKKGGSGAGLGLTGNPADQYRSTNPRGQGPQRSTGKPKKPKKIAPSKADPYKSSVLENLQYLTNQQRAETQKRQAQLDKLKLQAKAAQAQLIKMRDLREKGEQGVRAQQALLRQAGYNIAVDGKYGQQTDAALSDYLTKQSEAWNSKLTGQAKTAHPLTLRAEANAKFKPEEIKNNRDFILGHITEQLRELPWMLAQAEQAQRDGKSGAGEKAKNIRDAIAGLEDLRKQVMDPVKGLDPTDLNRTMRKIILLEKEQLQQANLQSDSGEGFWEHLSDAVLGTLSTITETLFNRGSSAFAAGFMTKRGTGDNVKALQAFVGGFSSFVRVPFTDLSLVGLVAPGGSDARKFIESTNTQGEMDDLVAQGELVSFGQAATKRVTPEFDAKYPDALGPGQTVVKGFDPWSAALDVLAQPLKDPTLIGGLAIAPISKFGNVSNALTKKLIAEAGSVEEAARIVRTARIANPTGRALMSRVGSAVDQSFSALDLEQHIPGLDRVTVNAAMAAKEAADGGVEAAVAVIQDAFIAGRWNPHISVVRQLTNDIGSRIGLVGEEGTGFLAADVGRKAIKLKDRLAAVRAVAEPKSPVAAAFERDASTFVDAALKTAATAERTTVGALWDRVVGTSVRGLDFEARLFNAMAAIYKLDSPQLHAAFEGSIRRFAKDAKLLDNMPLGTYLETMFNQEGFEQVLKNVETMAALAGRNYPGAAAQQFAADLARGFLLPKNAVKDAFHTAVANAGLKLGAAKKGATRKEVMEAIRKLPVEDREFFTKRLLALRGKAGLGRLAKDVELAIANPELREELARLLEQQKGRAAQAAEGVAPKVGLGRKLRQLPNKLVLANADTVAPTEIRFKYKTANELFHAQLRAKAAERYLKAFYVPANTRATLIRAIEMVQTEEDLFKVVERMTRAALEAKGVTNPDGVMTLLKARGDFRKVPTKPVRTIIDGAPVEDLQTLAQRTEQARLFSPSEVAAEVRKAILDGIEDASTARQFAARLRVDVVDNVGNLKLHFTHLDGRVMTIASSARSFHRMWKFLIVTNAGMPIIGATAGFLGTQGDIGDKLHNAGLGFAIGSLGGVRYVFRIAGIEERSRILLDRGFMSDIHIPAWAKLRSRRYSEDPFRRTLSDNLVRLGNHGTNQWDNELLVHVDPDWVEVPRTNGRAVDAWYRIVNHQLHPETDPVTAILLREQAGHLGGEEEITRVVRVVAEDTRTPFQRQMDELSKDVIESGVGPARVTNEDLLADFAGRPTKTYWRGEDAAYPNRGDNWIPDSYNNGKGEQYARGHASTDGRVYKVELPVDDAGRPLVGEAAGDGNLGWVLAGSDSKWADAADEVVPPGLAATQADNATFKTVTERRTLTAAEDADRQIAEFLTTEEGQLWAARWRGAKGGAGTKGAVKRMRAFIARYSTPELANLRVAGGVNGVAGHIEHDTLKRLLKSGAGPESFHGQQVWKAPKNAKELFAVAGNIVGKTTLSGPSNVLNRGPYFRSLFYKEYDRLVMNGVERETAQQLADMSAANHLNQVLDRMDDPSRFAQKVDMFLPFQQAREDTVRAYGRLVMEHPVNSARLVADVGRAFNNGEDMGMFTKNEYTGEWEMTVPGSGRLSHSLFKLPFDVGFTTNLRDLLFLGNGAYDLGVLPQPGGLYWSTAARLVADAHPELFTGKYPLHEWLWGYGPQGNLLRKDTSRLWMAFTGESPPWERLTQDEWENQHNRWQTEIAQQLIYEHRKKHPTDRDWVPTDEDLAEATKKFYMAWAFIGTTYPATSYPTLTGKSKFHAAMNAFTVGGLLELDFEAFLKKYPEFEAYLVPGSSEYIGPDDLASLRQFGVGGDYPLQTFDPKTGKWSASGESDSEGNRQARALGYYENRSFKDFKDDFKFYRRKGDYWRKLKDAQALQGLNPIEGERALVGLNKEYADVVGEYRRDNDIKTDLYNINWKYPKALRASAIRRVQNQYGLTNAELNKYMAKASDPDFMPNAWRDARLGSEVDDEVRKRFGNTITGGTAAGKQAYGTLPVNGDVERYVATLNPAEQARYWQWQKQALGYDPDLDDPSKVMAQYKYFQSQLSAVYKEYPWLSSDDYQQGTRTQVINGKRVDTLTGKPYVNPYDVAVEKMQENLNKQTSATFNTINKVKAEMDVAAKAKNWKAYYALKEQHARLYDVADALHNKFLNNLPNLHDYYEDLHAAALAGAAGNIPLRDQYLHKAAMDKADAPFFLIPEQQRFLNEPPAVQRAYMATLVRGLDMPYSKGENYDTQKKMMDYVKEQTGLKPLLWEYLTPFQQDILERNFPQYVEQWKYNSEVALGSGGGKGPIPKELSWAYAQLAAYSKRGDMKRPASYDAYLRLPSNLAAREQFLKAHPDVRAYLNAGPFKHMPAELRDQVSSILNKYGNYNGYSNRGGGGGGGGRVKDRGYGYAGNVNVAWAKQQLYIWSRRKDATKPSNYDMWVNMPTGVEKAEYLKAHPELQEWIKLGPMSNMPDEYKQVVRDIMSRYGEWTQKDDPLAKTMTEFFKTPGYARAEFLQKHPELEAYWAATRSPEEQAMFDLRNQYFKIQDVGARQAFLASHPELQQDFIDARTRRYESFLNQVAVYMGANPEMFTQYLDRQTDIMAELLRKFAEPHLIREAGPTYVSAGGPSETGRQRQVQRAPRARVTA